jgi:ferredoxin-NADP reductase
VVLALTREPARRGQDFGRRVDAPMLRELSSRWVKRRCAVFVCGSNRFAEVASAALLAAGVPAASIRTEGYGG